MSITRLKAHLSYRERWRPETVSAALSRGKLFHSVLEAHYITKMHTDAKSELWVAGTLPDPWQILHDAPGCEETDTVCWLYDGYLETYGLDPEWEVLEVEQRVEDWLRLPNGRRSTFKLKGYVDLLVKDHSAGGGLWIVDHKTCRELPKQRALDFDDQMGIYTLLLRRQGLDIRGVIYNACRSYKLKRPMSTSDRFSRPLTVRTERELETIAQEALATFKSAYRDAPKTGLKATKTDVVGHTKAQKRTSFEEILPPRSPDPDRCRWRCPFTESCLMSRKGRDIRELLSETGFKQDFDRH